MDILNKHALKVIQLFGSKYFFWFVIFITIIQAAWYVVSFQPAMYDEPRHFAFTKMYAEIKTPLISAQDSRWDFLGETTREPNYLFFYLMSLPLSVVQFLGANDTFQLAFLRVLCLALFVTGLIYFRKAFLKFGISSAVINPALLLFVLIPGVAILPGVFSYDNVQILLVGLLLYVAARILQAKHISAVDLAAFLIIGLIGSPIKITFLPIYAIVFLYVTGALVLRHKKSLLPRTYSSVQALSKRLKITLAILLVLSMGIFAERTLTNLVAYRAMAPACTSMITRERCMANELTRRNMLNREAVLARGDSYAPSGFYAYLVNSWIPNIVKQHASPTLALPVVKASMWLLFAGGIVLILIFIRDYIRVGFGLLLTLFFVYVLTVLMTNYSTYVNQGMAVAINGRYIFPVLPIFIVLVFEAIRIMIGRRVWMTLPLLAATALVLSQGFGVATYIMDNFVPPDLKNEESVIDFRDNTRNLIDPLIID